jgi:deoxyribonuclease (pyrimidine dimer)
MTRINVIPPSELTNLHLIAEYRELPRIFALAKKHFESGKNLKNPKEYTLGKGHVLFFYDKLLFLLKRQESLIEEMQKRGIKTNFSNLESLYKEMPTPLMQDYVVTPEAIKINKARIFERLKSYEEKKKKS